MDSYIIDSHEVIKINHQKYFLSVRSNCRDGNVILCLHGGPGLPNAELIKHYNSDIANAATLVMWDQRGAGDAYSASFAFKKNLMKERLLDDINNVVNYLRNRFQQDKIILLGHSFGTVLSVWYTQQHPEKVAALINVSQLLTPVSEKKVNTSDILITLSALKDYFRNRKMKGLLKYVIGAKWSSNTPLAKEPFDFSAEVNALAVPLFVMMGEKDAVSFFEKVKEWFDCIAAPRKELYPFAYSGHLLLWEDNNKFNKIVKEITEQL